MPSIITVIGAGSQSFGLSTLSTLLRTPELRGSEIRLIDLDAEGLDLITRLGERMNREWGAECVLRQSTDRRELLGGSDFVILSVAIDRNDRWEADHEIGLRHGIEHYAENGGPGAFGHTTRNVHLMMPILRDIEDLAPEAYVLNFTNPVQRITLCARRHTKLNIFGICHQINHGYLIAGYLLRDVIGAEAPDKIENLRDPETKKILMKCARLAKERIDIKAAGLNHFTWMMSITEKGTNRDLAPLLGERLRSANYEFEPLSQRLYEVFGILPVSGDTHLSEYLPFTHNPTRGLWKRYDMWLYNFEGARKWGKIRRKRIEDMVAGTESIDSLRDSDSERVEAVIAAIATNQNAYEQAMNLPNCGHISNLPEGAVVEVPALIDAAGVHGLAMGPLPEGIAEFCRREIAIAKLTVDAAVEGDRAKAVQAMALNPMVDDLFLAEKLVEDYIEDNKGYFPEFG